MKSWKKTIIMLGIGFFVACLGGVISNSKKDGETMEYQAVLDDINAEYGTDIKLSSQESMDKLNINIDELHKQSITEFEKRVVELARKEVGQPSFEDYQAVLDDINAEYGTDIKLSSQESMDKLNINIDELHKQSLPEFKVRIIGIVNNLKSNCQILTFDFR